MTNTAYFRPSMMALCLAGAATFACGGDDGDEDSPPPPVMTEFPPSGADLVFAVIGDSGDTSDLAEGQTESGRVADLVKSWDPAVILTLGDNDYTDGAFEGTNTGLELGIGQYFSDYIGNYRGAHGAGSAENRFFPVPGDHDYGDDCSNPRLGDYLDYFTLPVGETDETYYDFRRGPVHFFALDSIRDCHQDGGAKMAAQEAWLAREAMASDAPFKVVFFHHPPYSSGERHGSAEYMRWPFADWGVQLVMSGDDHIYERGEHDGVTYLVNGLGGVEQHPVGAGIAGSITRYSAEFGAIGVAVTGGRMHVEFITVTGDAVDAFDILAEGVVGELDPNVAPVVDGPWTRLPVETTWQWQLQGTINSSYDVDVYDVDLFDVPQTQIAALQAAGRTVICYFSAGSFEDFRDDSAEFTADDYGNILDGFADERWLDVRSPNVHRIMKARLDLARSKGCDGVEPDNMDGYTNDTGLALTATDQLAFNRFMANEAHMRGLTVGLKNDLEQIPDLVAYYDFALNEQCHEYNECDTLMPFVTAGKAVFVAEYDARFVSAGSEQDALCSSSRAAGFRTLILSLDLDDSLRISCDP